MGNDKNKVEDNKHFQIDPSSYPLLKQLEAMQTVCDFTEAQEKLREEEEKKKKRFLTTWAKKYESHGSVQSLTREIDGKEFKALELNPQQGVDVINQVIAGDIGCSELFFPTKNCPTVMMEMCLQKPRSEIMLYRFAVIKELISLVVDVNPILAAGILRTIEEGNRARDKLTKLNL